MSNLSTTSNYAVIENYLRNKQQEVEQQLQTIENEDPVLAQLTVETSEAGTEVWEADAHVKSTAVKKRLNDFSDKIKTSLSKLQKGTYGVCDKCGHHIEQERLEALPIATLCLFCVAVLNPR